MPNDVVLPGLYIDTYDCAALGFQLSTLSGWRETVRQKWPTEEVPGRWGVVVTSSQPAFVKRNVRLMGTLVADDLATLRSNLDEFKYRLGKSDKEFTFHDDTTRKFIGRVVKTSDRPVRPHLSQTAFSMQIDIECFDPRIFAVSASQVGSIGNSDVPIPLGSAPSFPTLSVTGSGSFTITYKNYAATVLKELTITGASPTVTINMATGQITDSGGNALDHFDVDSDHPWGLDPDDGDYTASQWPTLRCGSGTMTCDYTKAWL
jgi:phage-related protein